MREIRLDADAQGILLALERQPAIRRAADGRTPKHDVIDLRLSDLIQLRVGTQSELRCARGQRAWLRSCLASEQ